MQRIIFKHLKIENFCGLKDFETDFFDKTIIKGANGLGKSTIANAITWTLTDKMADGSSPDSIRPKNDDGTDIDFIDISVTVTLMADDKEIRAQKIQKQNWITDKTTQNQRFKGNDNFFSINEIPKKKADYEAYLSEYVDLNLLLHCMSAYVFWSKDTKNRRSTLFTFKDNADDDVFAMNEKFEELRSDLEDGSLEELIIREKRVITDKKKELSEIPARIDEQNHNIHELSDEELATIKATLVDAEKKLEESTEIAKTFDDLSRKINEISLKITKIISDTDLANQRARAESGLAEQRLTQEIALIRGELPRIESRIKEAENRVADMKSSSFLYANDIEKIKAEEFNSENLKCPVCGSKYTKAKVDGMRKAWQESQDKKIEDLTRMSNDAEVRCQEIEADINKWKSEISEKQAQIEDKEKELAGLDKTEFLPIKVEDKPEYVELTKEIEKLKHMQENINLQSGVEKQALLGIITDCKTKINAQVVNESYKKRIQELEHEQLEVSQTIANAERKLDLLNEFRRAKIDTVTADINKYFDLITWRFFRLQVNGDYAETCEGLVDGISIDKTLNHGHRLLANLDLCKAFQRKAGISIPLFLDDAESVDPWRIPEIDGQMIVFRRTDDKSLVVESLS